jgi:zinc protease
MSSQHKKIFVFLIGLIFIVAPCARAQSGRKRISPDPAPQPAPQPDAPKSSAPVAPKSTAPPARVLVPAGAAIVSEEHNGVTSRYVFKNGITIIAREDHSAPIAACAVYVKAGTANDPEGQNGVARVVERLLTQSHKVGGEDMLQQARRLGGVLSSEIDFDATVYHLLAPSNNFAKLLELQFRNFQHENFSDEEVTRAAHLAAQDERFKLDDPFGYGQQRILEAAFEGNGNSANSAANLIAKEQAQAFYDRYYRANNIIVAIVGDVSADQARLTAQLHLGGLVGVGKPSDAGAKSTGAPAPEASNHLVYSNERADINQTIVSVGYRVPGLKEKEFAIFEVLRALLIDGRGALLPQALIEPSFASRVTAKYIASNKGGLFAFQMQIVSGKFVKAEEKLFEVIENMRRVILSAGELQRAKSLLEKQYYDRAMSSNELAGQLAFWEARGGYKNFDTYVKGIREVTGEQIQQMAAQYFNFNTAVVHEYEPRNAPPRIAGGEAVYTQEKFEAFINVLAPRTHKESVSKDEITYAPEVATVKQGKERHEQEMEGGFILELQPQPVRDFSTLRGPRAYVREDQSHPLLAIGIYFQGGRLLEKEGDCGITELMLRAMLRGTTRQSGADIALTLEQLGAELKIVNEPDFYGYTIEVLSRNAEPALKILIDNIESPAFDQSEFDLEKTSLLATVRARHDDGEHRPSDLFHNALYGSHPYGLPQLGLETSLEKLTQTDIVNWYQKTVKHQLPIVVMVGDTDGSALVGRYLADGFPRRDLDKSLSVPIVSTVAANDKVEQRERRQTTQVVGFSGPEGRSQDNYVMEVIKQIIDGPGGRFLSNPQQQELSFDLNIETEWRQQRSNFLVYINSAPDQEQRARALVEEEFKQLVNAPLGDNEVEAGRNCALAALLDRLHSHDARAVAYARNAFFGLPTADIDNLADKFGAIGKDDVHRVLQSYFLDNRRGIGVLRATPATPPASQPANQPTSQPPAAPNENDAHKN